MNRNHTPCGMLPVSCSNIDNWRIFPFDRTRVRASFAMKCAAVVRCTNIAPRRSNQVLSRSPEWCAIARARSTICRFSLALVVRSGFRCCARARTPHRVIYLDDLMPGARARITTSLARAYADKRKGTERPQQQKNNHRPNNMV